MIRNPTEGLGGSHDSATLLQESSRIRRRRSWRTFLFIIAALAVGICVLGLLWLPTRTRQNSPAFLHNSSSKLIEYVSQEPLAADSSCTCETPTSKNHVSFASTMVGLNGTIADCCCSFFDLEQANSDIIYPLLQKIVATPFFAHFKIDLYSDCDLWDDQPICMLRDCSVCEVDEPPVWAANVEWQPMQASEDYDCTSTTYTDEYNAEDRVVTTVDWHVQKDWSNAPTSFLDDEEGSSRLTAASSTTTGGSSSDKAVVVDLRLNPERYTGYDGASAAKVWSAIHLDNCFRHESLSECSLPANQRIYNRVISGMHSSISLHIAHSYCLKMDPNQIGECIQWGMNTDIAQQRVLRHRERLENLYVAFALLLRAVQKAGAAIAAAVPHDDPYYTDSLLEWTDRLWPELLRLAQSCPTAFDEASMLVGDAASSELLRRFRHLQRIMQCVGCDRCKLWGALQTLGIGTALKILMTAVDGNEVVSLSRQEAVALVHTLERFSSAIVYAAELAVEAS